MSAPDSRVERFRAVGLVAFPMGRGQELVFSEHSRTRTMLQTSDLDLLASCDRFKTLEDHARSICAGAGLPPDQVPVVLEQLVSYASRGLMLSEKSVRDGARPPEPSAAPPPIPTLAVITRNRPASLERCLAGYVENAREFGRTVRFVVLDDSPSPETRETVLRGLSALKARTGASIFYGGAEEKARYRDELARESGVDPALLDFALFDPEKTGHTPGANRNAFLLETVGERAVCVDDDTVCQVAPVPDPSGIALAVTSEPEVTETWHFPDRASALRAAPFVRRDFIGLHEEYLGKPVGQCIAEAAAGAVNLDTVDARFLRTLRNGKGRVRLSQIGLIGDCAQGSAHWVVSHQGRSRTRLLDSAEAYRTALRSREIIRGPRQATIGNRAGLMTYGAAYDHRELLVPFVPVMRGQDGLFVHTVHKCHEDASIVHLPWLLYHTPDDRKEFEPEVFWEGASSTHLLDLIGTSLGSYQHGPAKPHGAERLRALGTHLAELGGLPGREFEELFSRLFWQRCSYWMDELERDVESLRGTAPHWAEDLRKCVVEVRAAVAADGLCVPRDLEHGRTPAEARELGARILHRFGRLLAAWPEIFEAALRLKKRGVSLVRPV